MRIADKCTRCGAEFTCWGDNQVRALCQYERWLGSHHDNCKPEPWEPEGGDWYVSEANNVANVPTERRCRLAGRERKTRELAERAAEASRQRDVLEAFRDQYWPEWVDADYEAWCVKIDNGVAYISSTQGVRTIGTVYGPLEFAKTASEMINRGELKL